MTAAMLADAVAYHKVGGRPLCDALGQIRARCGYFQEGLHNVTLMGREGQERIAALMADLRQAPLAALRGIPVAFVDDYAVGTGRDLKTGTTYPLQLEKASVLHYQFADCGFPMVRPST